MEQLHESLVSEPPPMYLPLDIILYLSKFLNFEDYRSLVRSIWPDGQNQWDIVRATLWRLSTHTFEATFFNGKRLPIIYNFDAARMKEERVLIDTESLVPVFGGILPPAMEGFRSIPEVHKFIEMHVDVNLCSEGRHACCPCHLLYDDDDDDDDDDEDAFGRFAKPPVDDECKHGHFQHYCPQHVTSWLNHYLNTAILLRESKELFNDNIAEQYSFFAEDIVYFQTGKRATLEHLLKTALEIDAAIYESSDDE
ncbi:repeat element protein-d6.2 [Ichnoviriform fugitivi]|uniref:Repeat element protein-d6.2 n=1 Tax=Ichnoviriform fugitivi TaxID=265522 RepID=A2Q0L0_9VIRU|nr:repeat element protein-d6.2 [Ichnoviriform fugitivi]BAF45725.1 repeat element protein-d6.2 [Ichnoviriform fugitivi]